MEFSTKYLKDLKAALEKEHGRHFTDAEVDQVGRTMAAFEKLTADSMLEDERRLQLLRETPQGFHLDRDGYSCSICGGAAAGKESWFDLYGLKCMTCQGAINRQEVPAWLGQSKEAWYSPSELEMYFNLSAPVLRRWVEEKLLQPRTMTKNGRGIHLQVFLLEDNSSMLPPKKLLDDHSCTTIEIIDGQEFPCSRLWYQCVDPYQLLKDYRILDYLQFIS